MIVNVPGNLAPAMWADLEPLFARVTVETNGCYETEDVLAEIVAGKQVLWVAWDEAKNKLDAVMTTAIINYPRKRTCRGIYVAGSNMKHWLPEWIETIERYARDNGASALEGSFRKGWARVWPGGRISGVNMIKEFAA